MSDPFLGEIKMFGGTFAPRGWQLCNGQLLAIASNSALFSLLGTTYGGDGISTFALPDLRCRLPMHWGNGPGLTPRVQGEVGGTENTTLNSTQMPSHTHTAVFAPTGATPLAVSIASADVPATASNPGGNILAQGKDARGGAISDYAAATAATGALAGVTLTGTGAITVTATGGSTPVPIMPPYLVVNFIIALAGIFPSRN